MDECVMYGTGYILIFNRVETMSYVYNHMIES